MENIEIDTNNKVDPIIISVNDQNDFPEVANSVIEQDFENDGRLLVLFTNPISGSQEGKIIIALGERHRLQNYKDFVILKFPDCSDIKNKKSSKSLKKDDEKVPSEGGKSYRPAVFDGTENFTVIIFNILEKPDYKKGKGFIQTYLEKYPNNSLKILIGGGDGTVLRLVEELNEQKVNLTRCIFGHIPLGTGNDLSNAMGFGNQVGLSKKISYFHRVLYTYIIAERAKIDIWELTVSVKDNGLINEVKKDGEQTKMDETGKEIVKSFIKTFINYMSLGFDARVGFNFEQKRSSSRCCNKVIYAWEGLKRYLCCRKNIPLTTVLDSFEALEPSNIIQEDSAQISTTSDKELSDNKEEPLLEKQNKIVPLESSNPNVAKKKGKRITHFRLGPGDNQAIMSGSPVDIICQNINFYMGGTRNIWEHSGSQLGIEMLNAKAEDMKNYKNKVISKFNEQRYDDKKIEFFTYESGISMALEKVARGQANKVYQGEGPVLMTFKENPDTKEYAALNKVYLNVDGEFFHLLQPKELMVRLNTNICDGQINFLKNITGIKA